MMQIERRGAGGRRVGDVRRVRDTLLRTRIDDRGLVLLVKHGLIHSTGESAQLWSGEGKKRRTYGYECVLDVQDAAKKNREGRGVR